MSSIVLALALALSLHFPRELGLRLLPQASAVRVEPERFLGMLKVGGIPFAVMSTTESVLDGKPTPYVDIPDEGTELVEISIDLRRNVVTRVAYVTRRDM